MNENIKDIVSFIAVIEQLRAAGEMELMERLQDYVYTEGFCTSCGGYILKGEMALCADCGTEY